MQLKRLSFNSDLFSVRYIDGAAAKINPGKMSVLGERSNKFEVILRFRDWSQTMRHHRVWLLSAMLLSLLIPLASAEEPAKWAESHVDKLIPLYQHLHQVILFLNLILNQYALA